MTTRSAVDENTVLFSGLTGKTKAGAVRPDPSQSGAAAPEDEQAITKEEDAQDSKGQHLVSSKQQEGDPLLEPIEFDDTTELNIDDIADLTINKRVVNEIFSEDSSSSIYENDVILETVSYPDTICIQANTILRHREKDLPLIYTKMKKKWAVCNWMLEVSNIF